MPTRRHLIPAFVLLCVVAAIWLCAVAATRAQGPSRRPLLRPTGALRDHPVKGPKPRRAHQAALQLDVFAAADGPSAAPTIDLNLFDDVDLVAQVEQYEPRGPASFLWHGRLQGIPQGHATFVSTDGVIAGTVFADGVVYEIGYAGDGVYDVKELDPAAFPTDDPPEQLDLASVVQPDAPSSAIAADTAAQIDVLVAWTPAAETAAGGPNAMRSLVDLSVANANTAYANSGISTRLRLVYKTQVPYTESTISTDLNRLVTTNDGYVDAVHGLRDQYGADIVSLIGSGYTSSSSACGIGYLMSYVSSSFASTAFNVVDYSCAAGNLSYAHEVGHNEGMHHDPANASGVGAYSYSYGYVDPGCAFRTVMAYGGCPRVAQFSSPNVTYGGRVTGTATQNNALTLNNTASTVANFRQAVTGGCTYALSSSSWTAPSGGGTSSVDVTVTGTGCSWTATSSASWLTITSGASGSGNGTIGFSAGANTGASSRSATVTVGGRTLTVTQAGVPCSYTLSSPSFSAPSTAATSAVSVTSPSGCGWTATSAASWVTVTSGASGNGNGTVGFSVSANATNASRSTTLTVAGHSFSISQAPAPCTFSLSATSFSAPAGGAASSVVLTAVSGCTWTVTSSAAWLAVTSAGSGTGNATISYTAAANTSPTPRTAMLSVGGRTFTVTQAGAACTFTITPASFALTATGGTYTVAVRAGTGCGWTAASGASWISIASGASGTANGTASFTVSPNVSITASRAGSLTVAGKTVSVSQAAAPPVQVRSLTATRTYPLPTGQSTTWSASASGGSTALEYKYWRYSGKTGGWTVVRDYARDSSFTWTPTTGEAGSYALQVWVRQVGSTVNYDGWAGTGTFSVIAPAVSTAPVTMTSFSANVAFPKPAGTQVTWTAVAAGGNGSLEYQFWVYNGSAWSIARAYGPGNQFTWTPAIGGTYALQAWVRQVGVTANYQAWLGSGFISITAPIDAPVTTVSLTANRAVPVATGTTLTWTSTANSTNAEYEFWLYDGVAWTLVQPYGVKATFVWSPSAPGSYAVQAWARRVGSTASYEAWSSSGVFGVSP